jgi:hypothetical protein
MVRDNALVSLFDGSTVVNLHAIVLQLRHLANQRAKVSQGKGGELASRLEGIFSLDKPLPNFDPGHLTLFNHGHDDVLQGIDVSLVHLETLRDDPEIAPELLQAIIALTQDICMGLDAYVKIFKDLPLTKGYNEPPAFFELAKQYCTLHAAATCVHMWLYNRRHVSEFFAKGEWLALCLHRLMRTFQPMREPLSCVHVDGMAQELIRLYEDHRLFSIVPFRLARPEQARG